MSFFGSIFGEGATFGSVLGDIAKPVLKEAVSFGTGLAKQAVAKQFAPTTGQRPPRSVGQRDPVSVLSNLAFGAAQSAGRSLVAGGPATLAAGRSSVGNQLVRTVPFNVRQLPTQAFRDLPGGVKAGFIKGKGTTFKTFMLEDGTVVLREHKPRRMNPCNMRALSRAIRRVESFGRVVKRARKITNKVKKI